MIRQAGLAATCLGSGQSLLAAVADGPVPAVVVIDLADDQIDGVQAATDLRTNGFSATMLGYYAHTDTEIKRRAEAVGFDLVVPRSRLAREGSQLITKLCVGASG